MLAVAALLVAPAAHAGGVFLGASLGQSDLETDVFAAGFDGGDTGWKLFGGFHFLKFFALEGGYINFGSPDESLFGRSANADVDGWDVYAVGVVPIRKLELFAKAGLIYWDYEFQVISDPDLRQDDDGIDIAYGLGVAWKFTDSFALRGEYEVFDIGAVDDLTFLSVGVDFRF